MRYSSLFLLVFCISGCGNYTSQTRSAREEFYSGKYTEAAKRLEAGARKKGVDQLLYLLDRATILHHAGQFEESNEDFHRADKLAEIKDYTSLATEAATLVTNDRIVDYKGEDFEKVLISQYLALNYLFLQKYEDALVESRRVNHKLHLMITEGKRKYKLNPMARYLSALIYENSREWNDAYIDYVATFELVPEFPYLREDLYRMAYKSKLREEAERWVSHFGLSTEEQKRIRESADLPEIVILAEVGRSPEKHPHPMWSAIPKYYPRENWIDRGQVFLNGNGVGQTDKLFDIEKTAIENLDEKYAAILIKKFGGVVVKEVVAHEVSKQDPLLGLLVWFGMHVANQADLRSWLTLPKNFQILRIRLPKEDLKAGGTYKIRVEPSTLEKTFFFDGKVFSGTTQRRAFVPVRLL